MTMDPKLRYLFGIISHPFKRFLDVQEATVCYSKGFDPLTALFTAKATISKRLTGIVARASIGTAMVPIGNPSIMTLLLGLAGIFGVCFGFWWWTKSAPVFFQLFFGAHFFSGPSSTCLSLVIESFRRREPSGYDFSGYRSFQKYIL